MPVVPSTTSERIAPRTSIGHPAQSSPAVAGVGGGAGVSVGLAAYTYFYGGGGLGVSGTFTFGENGEGAPTAWYAVPDTIGLTWSAGPTPLHIPAHWMWWAAIHINTAESTPPADESFVVTGVGGSGGEYQTIVPGASTSTVDMATSGYSGASPQVCSAATLTTLLGTSFTVVSIAFDVMAIEQANPTVGQLPTAPFLPPFP